MIDPKKFYGDDATHRFLSIRWVDIRTTIRRWFNRERELVRLRVAMGMMSEGRQRDAEEYHEMLDGARRLSERVRELEHEREQWRRAALEGTKEKK